MDTLGELLRLRVVWKLTLHPDGISIWRIGNGSVDGAIAATLQSVVTLTGSGAVPVPVDIHTSDGLGDSSRLSVALALNIFQELGGQFLLVDVYAGIDGINDGLVEELKTSLFGPFVFNGLELSTGLASLLSSDHEIVEGLEIWVGRTKNVGMVTGVDRGGDECGSFSISSGNCKEIRSLGIVSKEPLQLQWIDVPIMSACARMAIKRLMCSLIGTSTFPAM